MKLSEEHPELYHYTNKEGLEGIITSQSLWATRYDCLNDSEEMLSFEKILKNYYRKDIEALLREKRAKIIEEEVMKLFPGKDAVDSLMGYCMVIFRKALLMDNFAVPYITSFCSAREEYEKNNGRLSQWKRYGGEDGYALVFDAQRLEDLMSMEGKSFKYVMLNINSVVYDDGSVPQQLFTEIEQLRKCIIDTFGHILFGLSKLEFTSEILGGIMQCMARCKHQGFIEEKEVRLIAFMPSANSYKGIMPLREIKTSYSDKKKKDTAHIELFKKRDNVHEICEFNLPITKIIVGPSVDKKERAEDLVKFLNNQKVEVAVSETPLI